MDEQVPIYISMLWQSVILWTAALSSLLDKEEGDPDGERAARMRINREMAFDGVTCLLAPGDKVAPVNNARDMFSFWWPTREAKYDQPHKEGMTRKERTHWDLSRATTLVAFGDARRAATSVRATPETRAFAYVLFAHLGTAWDGSDCTIPLIRALTLIPDEHNNSLPEEQQRRRQVIRSESKKAREVDPETTFHGITVNSFLEASRFTLPLQMTCRWAEVTMVMAISLNAIMTNASSVGYDEMQTVLLLVRPQVGKCEYLGRQRDATYEATQ